MADLSVHHRVVERLLERLYNRRIIDNVDRGVYLQYMIELPCSNRIRRGNA